MYFKEQNDLGLAHSKLVKFQSTGISVIWEVFMTTVWTLPRSEIFSEYIWENSSITSLQVS